MPTLVPKLSDFTNNGPAFQTLSWVYLFNSIHSPNISKVLNVLDPAQVLISYCLLSVPLTPPPSSMVELVIPT